jgi:hypothetical protein
MPLFVTASVVTVVILIVASLAIYFSELIKNNFKVVETINTAIAGVASFAIAFFAIKIDSQIHDSTVTQAQTNRSVTLSDSIWRDSSVQKLAIEAARVEHAYVSWMRREQNMEASRSELLRAKIKFVVRKVHHPKRETLRPNLVLLLQHIDRAVNCIKASSINPKPKCDRSTFLALSDTPLADLYFIFRSVYFCDPFFVGQGHIPANEYAELVYDFKKSEREEKSTESQDEEPLPIYHTLEDARDDGHKIYYPEEPYILIEFPDTNGSANKPEITLDQNLCGFYEEEKERFQNISAQES